MSQHPASDIVHPTGKEDLYPIRATARTHRKTSLIWNYFVHLHPDHIEYGKNVYVCLLCREKQINKIVKLGNINNISPTGLMNHIRSNHKEEHESLVEKKVKEKQTNSSLPKITGHFQPKLDVKIEYKKRFAKWVVEDNQPFGIGQTDNFCSMATLTCSKISVPDRNELLNMLHEKKEETALCIRSMISDNWYSITTDHWTSISNDNYGALTLHFIHNFELKAFVLSFEKHKGGCSGEELERQLMDSLRDWNLPKNKMTALVSDSASNMNRMGELIMSDKYSDIHHHYCTDHIIHLTALKAFSNDCTVSPIKALKNLVNYINSSPQANEKLANCQQSIHKNKRPLKLLGDVKTRWWSTYTMVARAIRLREALELLKRNELIARQQKGIQEQSKIEDLMLTEEQFQTLEVIEEVLKPFSDAQRCLEGDKYVNISLIVLCIKRLHGTLHSALAASVHNQELYDLLHDMITDFDNRWGQEIQYNYNMVRRAFRRQEGIPRYAYWGALLDPRTKKITMKMLDADERRRIWADIKAEIYDMVSSREDTQRQNENINTDRRNNNNNKGAASFLQRMEHEMSDEDDTNNNEVEAQISNEVMLYEKEKGCALCDEKGNYNCPLLWWKANYYKYPHVWMLAERVLSIPATSAPSERVFSAASNVINKKRARLTPENAGLILFLRGNKTHVDWA